MNQRRRINIRVNVATLENVTYVIKRVVPTVINNRKIQHLRRRRVNLTVFLMKNLDCEVRRLPTQLKMTMNEQPRRYF